MEKRGVAVESSEIRAEVGDGVLGDGTREFRLEMTPEWVAFRLGIVVLILGLLSLVAPIATYALGRPNLLGLVPMCRYLFYLGRETSVGTWFASVLLLLAAISALVIARDESARRTANRVGWWVVSIVFLYLAIDEVAMIHETFRALPWHLMGGAEILPRGRDWILVALPLVILVVVILFPWSLRLPRRTLLLFVGSAALFLGGSIGFELIEGYYGFQPDSQPLVIQSLISVEEVLEMAGVILAFYAILDYARMQRIRVALGFEDSTRSALARS